MIICIKHTKHKTQNMADNVALTSSTGKRSREEEPIEETIEETNNSTEISNDFCEIQLSKQQKLHVDTEVLKNEIIDILHSNFPKSCLSKLYIPSQLFVYGQTSVENSIPEKNNANIKIDVNIYYMINLYLDALKVEERNKIWSFDTTTDLLSDLHTISKKIENNYTEDDFLKKNADKISAILFIKQRVFNEVFKLFKLYLYARGGALSFPGRKFMAGWQILLIMVLWEWS